MFIKHKSGAWVSEHDNTWWDEHAPHNNRFLDKHKLIGDVIETDDLIDLSQAIKPIANEGYDANMDVFFQDEHGYLRRVRFVRFLPSRSKRWPEFCVLSGKFPDEGKCMLSVVSKFNPPFEGPRKVEESYREDKWTYHIDKYGAVIPNDDSETYVELRDVFKAMDRHLALFREDFNAGEDKDEDHGFVKMKFKSRNHAVTFHIRTIGWDIDNDTHKKQKKRMRKFLDELTHLHAKDIGQDECKSSRWVQWFQTEHGQEIVFEHKQVGFLFDATDDNSGEHVLIINIMDGKPQMFVSKNRQDLIDYVNEEDSGLGKPNRSFGRKDQPHGFDEAKICQFWKTGRKIRKKKMDHQEAIRIGGNYLTLWDFDAKE